jgi:hypothetical protein
MWPAACADLGMVNTSVRSPLNYEYRCLDDSVMRALIEHRHRDDVGELMDVTISEAKRAARVLREQLHATGLTHSRALEIVAQQLGYQDWNTASAKLHKRAEIGVPVPVLRSLDEARAREFYLGFLSFSIEWEHRFEPNSPLYMRLRRGRMVLDLSEHHGDGTPGSTIWVPVDDVQALQKEFDTKDYRFMRPGIDTHAPGGPTMDVFDPFSNTIRFCQTAATGG